MIIQISKARTQTIKIVFAGTDELRQAVHLGQAHGGL